MITCWSVKGGSGATVVSVALAMELGRDSPAILADAGGDAATVLAATVDSSRPGLAQWLASGPQVDSQALERLWVPVCPELQLLPPGPSATTAVDPFRQAQRLAAAFEPRHAVVDAGNVLAHPVNRSLAEAATTSLLVIRPCFLAVQRASECGLRPDALVLIDEPGRALDVRDVEEALGVSAAAVLRWDAEVARRVDAGRLKSRLPRAFRPLQRLAQSLIEDGGASLAS